MKWAHVAEYIWYRGNQYVQYAQLLGFLLCRCLYQASSARGFGFILSLLYETRK